MTLEQQLAVALAACKPVPAKTTYVCYVNVYNDDNDQPMLGWIHSTKELAEKNASHGSRGVARVEWQE